MTQAHVFGSKGRCSGGKSGHDHTHNVMTSLLTKLLQMVATGPLVAREIISHTQGPFRHSKVHTLLIYLVRVSEIGRYFSWLLLCDRACSVQPPAFFLSRVLLLGFAKLLSIKKKCHCRFVVMCVGFTTNCQNMSRSKSLPPDIQPLLFYTPRPTQ